MGGGGEDDPKQQMTDEEYGEYLKQSDSFCGRLWANLDSREGVDLDDSGASTWSIGDLCDSYLQEDLDDPGSPYPSTSSSGHMDDPPFPEDLLSSTFIIDDAELAAGLSTDDDFTEDMEDSTDYGEEALVKLIIKDNGARALQRPMTNPCA